MGMFKKCSFYREEGQVKGKNLRTYCDLDQDWVLCRGDIQSCKKIPLLKKHLLKERKKEEAAGG